MIFENTESNFQSRNISVEVRQVHGSQRDEQFAEIPYSARL
jgi:hypothetical protein